VEFPRPLTRNERAVVEALLPEHGFRDVDSYRAQLRTTTVDGQCTCGCPTIYLRVDDSAQRSQHSGVPSLPLWAEAGDPTDVETVIEMSLWAPEGVLTELNVQWYGSHPPAKLPDAAELTVGPAPEPIRIE
jgi:hypothetical protein